MKRFTTDNPETNCERLLNFSYCEDKNVKLLYAGGKEHVDLIGYIADMSKDLGCNLTPEDIMDGACMDCDCVLSVLYVAAIQGAELREQLKRYEDTGLTPKEAETLANMTLTQNERRQRLGLHAVNDNVGNFIHLSHEKGGDASG
ncbi:MAG: hypothetical protein PUF80_00540 [Firmicutes bacterium]|nr:hypothetical protein [Bacillota bacterium]